LMNFTANGFERLAVLPTLDRRSTLSRKCQTVLLDLPLPLRQKTMRKVRLLRMRKAR
jgi:hypothetical protein